LRRQRRRFVWGAAAAGDACDRAAIPAIFDARESMDIGGLIAYGAAVPDGCRCVRDLCGPHSKRRKDQPDLPVVQTTKFELVINLKTAKALGLEIYRYAFLLRCMSPPRRIRPQPHSALSKGTRSRIAASV
jgi:hypothetical protein